MSKPFELLVFDWDGTLIDSQARIVNSFLSAIAEVGLPALTAVQIRQIIGLGLETAIATLYPQVSSMKREQLQERYRHHYLATTVPSMPFSEVPAMLDTLHAAGYWLAVATGKSRIGLDRAFAESGLGWLFHTSRCADETYSKPHPQMLLEIMDELTMPPEKTLVIGDTEYDLEMARNANVAAIAVTYGVHDQERLLACSPLACFDNLALLPTWLSS